MAAGHTDLTVFMHDTEHGKMLHAQTSGTLHNIFTKNNNTGAKAGYETFHS